MGREGPPGLSDTEADRVRAVMRDLLRTKFDNNRTNFAKALGIKQPAVSQLLGNPAQGTPPKNRPGERTARMVANLADKPDGFWRDDFVERTSETASLRDLTLARERAKLVTLARRLVLGLESVKLLADPESTEGLVMDALPEHIRRAALAVAHLENCDAAAAILAAERAVRDLGPDHGGKDPDGWLQAIRTRLNSGSGARRLAPVPPPPGKRVR